jgi:hypothetical protein
MKRFVEGKFYRYDAFPPIRKNCGATAESKWECVAAGARFAILYFDGRKCGQKETTVGVEHGDGLWKKA